MQLVITLDKPSPSDQGTFVLGWWFGGGNTGYRKQFHLKDMYKSSQYTTGNKLLINPLFQHISTFKSMTAVSNPTFEDVMAIETGFSDLNLWLEWMKYIADKHNQSNCYVCGKARPHLGTVPLNIPQNQEDCFLSLYNNTHTNDSACEIWKKEYPLLSKNPNPGNTITVYPGNYICYVSNSTNGRSFGTFPTGYCSEKRYTYIGNHTRSLGDIFWLCGDMRLRTKIDTPWRGECALAKIIMPIHVLTEKQQTPISSTSTRTKRDVTPGGSLDPHVYIDVIGVPRGVPNEFKARDQVAAGFESLIPIITVNKNVDWINYIYYNQQRFVNYTRDALQGVAEQLEASSQMTFQTRMAVDMMLAEKGGTCVYINMVEGCCTFIPDSTGPNGKVTVAIKKLTDLSIELKKNSGIDNPWDQYFGWFNKWKQVLVQFGLYILVILFILLVTIFCILPCCRKITARSIDASFSNNLLYNTSTPSPEDYAQYLSNYRARKNKIKNQII